MLEATIDLLLTVALCYVLLKSEDMKRDRFFSTITLVIGALSVIDLIRHLVGAVLS